MVVLVEKWWWKQQQNHATIKDDDENGYFQRLFFPVLKMIIKGIRYFFSLFSLNNLNEKTFFFKKEMKWKSSAHNDYRQKKQKIQELKLKTTKKRIDRP